MSRQQLYLDHLELIEQVIRFTCRRHRCSADEAEEFGGVARLALVKGDYSVLAAFEGRSKLSTYLTVVLQRLFLEFRVHKWGRWRPSAEAKRLGPLAIRLETLISREGLSLEEAFQRLHAIDPDFHREQATELAARLPARPLRRFEDEEALADLPSPGPAPEAALLDREAAAQKRRATACLADVIAALPAHDQLILRLRFGEGRQIVEIAEVLQTEARPLYRRIERLAQGLRQELEARGVASEDFGWGASQPEKRSYSAKSSLRLGKRATESVHKRGPTG